MRAEQVIVAGLKKLGRPEFLLKCGGVGPLLFIVVFFVEGLTRPAYNPYQSMVSELELSSWGWQQIANFFLCGILWLAAVAGMRRVPMSGWARRFLTLSGLGLLMAGGFLTDPGLAYPADAPHALPAGAHTWHGLLHGIAGAIVFFSLPIACAFTAVWLVRRGHYAWFAYTLGTLIVGFASFMIAMADQTGPAGVFQRVTITTYFVWFALLSLHLLRAVEGSMGRGDQHAARSPALMASSEPV